MRYNEIKEKIIFKNEMRGHHHGQSDMTLRAQIDNELVGLLHYVEYEGEPSISMIEVSPKFRRKGVARSLVYELQRMYPDREIDWGMTTDDGSMLYSSLKFKEVPVFDVERYNKLKNKFDNLTAEMERDWNKVTEKQRNDWYRLEDIIDRIERTPEFHNRVKKIIVTD
jgi:hypothetical protein